MDLYAYNQIDRLHEIYESIGIEVPRLRGLRYMKEEEPISKEQLDNILEENEFMTISGLLFDSFYSLGDNIDFRYYISLSEWKRIRKYFILKDKIIMRVNWNNIHGRKRKVLKYELKKNRKRIIHAVNTFNKYVGKEVLNVHARIGGDNWTWMNCDKLTKEPAFLDRADDYFDNTYADVYLKIGSDI